MNILILGYGKMGKTIESIALKRGHSIKYKIDVNNVSDLQKIEKGEIDVAIEFSQPDAAYSNIKFCLENGIPIVSGTTGWLEKRKEIEEICKSHNGAFFYASNYSIGVNLFFKLNKFLAKLMNEYSDYEIKMEEIHHTEKKDAPSGTAITLVEGIIENISRKTSWVNNPSDDRSTIEIVSKRIDQVPGTHTISYQSQVDDIEIKHTAHSRLGFALGAVLVAEWIPQKQGVLSMEDFLSI